MKRLPHSLPPCVSWPKPTTARLNAVQEPCGTHAWSCLRVASGPERAAAASTQPSLDAMRWTCAGRGGRVV
eukprot:5312925-Prymnesium_polylepis.2